jgi:hypothetical protein
MLAGLALGAAASVARADSGNGLAVAADAPTWSRWQGRVALNTSTPLWRADLARGDAAGLKVEGLSLIGDYYFAHVSFGAGWDGGFRATSGVLLGNGAPLWAPAAQSISGLSLGRRNTSLLGALPNVESAADNNVTVPYIGFGYSGLSGRSGFSFAADLGVMALNPGSAVRLGRLFNGNQSLDDLLRDIRLTPTLQLGVSYSF